VTYLAGEYPARWPRRRFGCPRAGLYRIPAVAADEARLRAAVERVAGAWPTYGYRRAMRELGPAAGPPPRRVRTTDSDHPFPRYPNRVADLTVTRPDQVWVADITHVRVRADFVYLAVLMGVFTRVIRGWELSRSLDHGPAPATLGRAVGRGRPGIHHPDQGAQYAATAFVERRAAVGAAIGMAAVGVPEGNGYAERLMRTIKEEEVALTEYRDCADARRQLGRFLDAVYNRKRIHSALGYLTPAEYEQQWRADRRGSPVVQ
jgi:transposase InsO family protein